MKKIIIAIDGYSSCGKSTLAKRIAKELNYIYIDTGAMYRSVALYCLRNKIIVNGVLNQEKLITSLNKIDIVFKFNNEINLSETYLNGENVEDEIRGIEVSNYVSKVAQIKEVRKKMIDIQRELVVEKGLVMDGRDIGSVVFPDAELKIFMTANLEVRVERRLKELKMKKENVSYEDVIRNIESRDKADIGRIENPLIQADDAVVIDNSNITPEEQFNLALDLIKGVLV